MPIELDTPDGITVLQAKPLRQETFSSFGTVIENPTPTLLPSPHISIAELPVNAVSANQGSALKYLDITHIRNLYGSAPSQKPSKAVLNMFVCAPRPLRPSTDTSLDGYFEIGILERHPYTTQTFIPLGISPSARQQARYLVMVAPTLVSSSANETVPIPPSSRGDDNLPGRGLPDLTSIQAFLAKGSQAVTYGAGTWHAPMAVVGKRAIDFVVLQFTNGIDVEDCQEAEFRRSKESRISVAVPNVGAGSHHVPKL